MVSNLIRACDSKPLFLSSVSCFFRFRENANRGQGLVEYGLIMSLVVLAAIVGVSTFGGGVLALFSSITSNMP